MSYDIAVVIPPIADRDATSWQGLDAMIELVGEPPALLQFFYDAVTRRYPCLSKLSDAESENGVWSSAPLRSGFESRAAVLAIQFPHAEVVVPFVVDTARPLGLTVFDWQTKLVHRPDGLVDLELASEDVTPLKRPTLHQILDAAQNLTPEGGPGFLVLERAGRDYLQVAGGKGAYTCEWRQYDGEIFKHWTAGLKVQADGPDVQVATNGFYVAVKHNECIGLADIKTLLTAFANSGGRPAQYSWRDITSRFA
jgi:hypothetical protein